MLFMTQCHAAIDGRLIFDVNEQNPEAALFYQRCGCQQICHSVVNASGNLFPALHPDRGIAVVPSRSKGC